MLCVPVRREGVMFRCNEPGMVPIIIPDGRRGLWTRETRDERGRPTRLDICAGREGDDAFVSMAAGVPPTSLDLFSLHDALSCLGFAFDLATERYRFRSRIRTPTRVETGSRPRVFRLRASFARPA